MKSKTKIVNISDIKIVLGMKGRFGSVTAFFAMKLLGLNKINSFYSKISEYKNRDFTENIIKVYNIKLDTNPSELDYIPKEGAFITVSNHPFGIIDGMALYSLVSGIAN